MDFPLGGKKRGKFTTKSLYFFHFQSFLVGPRGKTFDKNFRTIGSSLYAFPSDALCFVSEFSSQWFFLDGSQPKRRILIRCRLSHWPTFSLALSLSPLGVPHFSARGKFRGKGARGSANGDLLVAGKTCSSVQETLCRDGQVE